MGTSDDDARDELVRERDLLGTALAESERLTRGILAAVPAGVVVVTSDGAIRDANAEALRLLGLTYDDLTERYTTDFEAMTVWEDGDALRGRRLPGHPDLRDRRAPASHHDRGATARRRDHLVRLPLRSGAR